MKKQTLHNTAGAWHSARSIAAPYRQKAGDQLSPNVHPQPLDFETPFLSITPHPGAGATANKVNHNDLFLQLHCLADYIAWENGALPTEYRSAQASELLHNAIAAVGRAAANRQVLIQHTMGHADPARLWDAARLEKLFLHMLCAVLDVTPPGESIYLFSEGIPSSSGKPGEEQIFQLQIICRFPTDEASRKSIAQLEHHRSFALAHNLNASMSGAMAYNNSISTQVIWRLQIPHLKELVATSGNTPDTAYGDLPKYAFPYASKVHTSFLDGLYSVFEREIDNPDLDTETIARMLTMSRAKLHRRLTGLTGKSAHELLRDFRLERAMMLLRAGGCNVGETAWQTGFSNSKYFATAFRKKFGFSPSSCLKDSKSNLFETKTSL